MNIDIVDSTLMFLNIEAASHLYYEKKNRLLLRLWAISTLHAGLSVARIAICFALVSWGPVLRTLGRDVLVGWGVWVGL